jgi:hypothetical protein
VKAIEKLGAAERLMEPAADRIDAEANTGG